MSTVNSDIPVHILAHILFSTFYIVWKSEYSEAGYVILLWEELKWSFSSQKELSYEVVKLHSGYPLKKVVNFATSYKKVPNYTEANKCVNISNKYINHKKTSWGLNIN